MRYVIREKFFHLGEDSTITDEAGQLFYRADGKVFSIHHTVVLRDLTGNELATVKQQVFAYGLTYHITRHGQEAATVRKKILSPFIDRYTVDIPGPDDLFVTGSLLETETYGLETAPGEDDILLLAIVLALNLAEDQKEKNR